ncbi:MAG: DNA gyrase subunit B, partial [Polyangiaceae bacterium]|nr:DNA gyrase subunit B [Polyangiaceae bacterium]
DKRCDARVVAAVIRATGLNAEAMRRKRDLEEAATKIREYMQTRYPDLFPLTIEVGWDTAEGAGFLEVRPRAGASMRPARIDLALTKTDRGEEDIADGEALAEFLEERGKKGLTISRYKGLGEMNASELWETTMSPDARTLLQVRVDDAVATDGLFTILMGDQVEPRRAFIEENALQVKNLDI